jgi:hypothetical protein
MKTENVFWYSDGDRVSGLLRLPDDARGPLRAIVQGPGWMGLKDAALYVRYHEALTAAGFAVLIFDYPGFGDSEGDRTPPVILACAPTTPTDHAVAIYEAARGPKRLLLQRHTTHYASYDRYWEVTTPELVAWFNRYLGPADIITRSAGLDYQERAMEVNA